MSKEEIKQYIKDNLRIHADFEDGRCEKRLVLTITLEREKVSETKLYL